MFNSMRTRKRVLLVAAALFILVVGWFVFRFFNPNVGFTYYEPTYALPNVAIEARRISITPRSTSVEQDFRKVDWVYEIQEYKATDSIGTAMQNYDPKSIKPTCDLLTSPAKQQYRLCHWVDYGRIDDHQVIFIKHGTYIRLTIPTTLQQQITTQQINTYVDSFKQHSTFGIHVLRSNF